MIGECRIFDGDGNLKRVVSAKELRIKFWRDNGAPEKGFIDIKTEHRKRKNARGGNAAAVTRKKSSAPGQTV